MIVGIDNLKTVYLKQYPYSCHSFIFPFIWKTYKRNKIKNIYEIFEKESENNIWEKEESSIISDNTLRTDKKDNIDKNSIQYDLYQYFNEMAINLIFSEKNNQIVYNFKIKDEYLENLQYKITIKDNNTLKTYELSVKNILLKFYTSNIGIFILNCENYNNKTITDVKSINEYGRRLAYSFWPSDGYTKCAECLELTGKRISAKDDFKSFQENEVSFSYISRIIRDLLNKNAYNIKFRAKWIDERDQIQIVSVIDEKMYVGCLVNDEKWTNDIYSNYEPNNTFEKVDIRSLVELANVDIDQDVLVNNDISKNETFIKNLNLYYFTKSNPKLFLVTKEAFILLVSNGNYEYNYFYSVYMNIILIALLQRYSIERFKLNISELTEQMSKASLKFWEVKKIMNAQKEYISFQNKVLLREITVRKIGIYIYEKLQNELCINDENELYKKQINSLFELVNTNQTYTFNKWAHAFSIFSIEIGLLTLIYTIGNVNKMKMPAVCIAITILYIVYKIIKNRKE